MQLQASPKNDRKKGQWNQNLEPATPICGWGAALSYTRKHTVKYNMANLKYKLNTIAPIK